MPRLASEFPEYITPASLIFSVRQFDISLYSITQLFPSNATARCGVFVIVLYLAALPQPLTVIAGAPVIDMQPVSFIVQFSIALFEGVRVLLSPPFIVTALFPVLLKRQSVIRLFSPETITASFALNLNEQPCSFMLLLFSAFIKYPPAFSKLIFLNDMLLLSVIFIISLSFELSISFAFLNSPLVTRFCGG